MRYTPVELRHVRIGRSLFGFRRGEVEDLLEDVADSFEEVWRERGELADRLEDIEKQLTALKDREQLLASTLVSAEKAAVEAKAAAKREAELIVAEAHQESRSIIRSAQGERERLFGEARRIESLLRTALGVVEESKRREDTAEFESLEHAHRQVAATASEQAVRRAQADESDDESDEDAVPLPPPLPAAQAEHGEEGLPSPPDFAWG